MDSNAVIEAIEYVDYLSFILVSIAFNFAAIFWNRKLKNDSIENLFVQDKERIEQEASGYRNKIENFKAGFEVPKEVSEADKKRFLIKKEKFERIYQSYTRIRNRLQCEMPCSYCFNMVCMLLGLYGMMQLYMLPDIPQSPFLRNAYLYCTEIMAGILVAILILEGICKWVGKSEPFHAVKISIWGGILALGISYWLSHCTVCGTFAPFKLCCDEERFVYVSIFLPYISFVVYFIFQTYDYVKSFFYVRHLARLSKRMSALLE